MKVDIELERLKKVDFLNLFEIELVDYNFNITIPFDGAYNSNMIRRFDYCYSYNVLIKGLRYFYANLERTKEKYKRMIRKKIPKIEKDIYKYRINKIDNYLLNEKLKEKLPEKNKKEFKKI